jgi:hypothetical protein
MVFYVFFFFVFYTNFILFYFLWTKLIKLRLYTYFPCIIKMFEGSSLADTRHIFLIDNNKTILILQPSYLEFFWIWMCLFTYFSRLTDSFLSWSNVWSWLTICIEDWRRIFARSGKLQALGYSNWLSINIWPSCEKNVQKLLPPNSIFSFEYSLICNCGS